LSLQNCVCRSRSAISPVVKFLSHWEIFAPKGLEDSAQGLNHPENRHPERGASEWRGDRLNVLTTWR